MKTRDLTLFKFYIMILFPALSQSCQILLPPSDVLVIDKDMNPAVATNQLTLGLSRGNHLISISGTVSKEVIEFDKMMQTETWILKNWGNPDRIEKANRISYFIYEKKSKSAPDYAGQFVYGETPVKLGYRDGRLVYAEAYFQDRPSFKGRNPYTLPK